jgi:hypothetical protein
LNTKNVLMLVVLSAGMLAGLTATTIQAAPAFAETDDCEDNDDNNCNEVTERGQSITQHNDCKIEDGGSGDSNGGAGGSGDGGAGGSNGGNDNSFTCTNTLLAPNTGDLFSQVP